MTFARARKPKALPAAVYEAAYPSDPDFPQLPLATDPARMLEVFRAHLRPVAGRRCVIRDCVPFRFRCRQSRARCVLQYTLRLEDPVTGRRWEQWVTGVLYAREGEAERLWQELRADDPSRGIPADWLSFEPVGFVPELGMLVQIFPFDRKLRQLGRLLDRAAAELEPQILDRVRRPGEWRAALSSVVPTRYRTELGAALKLTLYARETSGARRARVNCYLKMFRNAQGEETFEFLRARTERPDAERRGVTVVRPIVYLSEWRTLVLEEARGVTLQQMLLLGHDPAKSARTVGRAVAAFNQEEAVTAQHHTLTDQLADVHRAAALVQWACPETREAVRRIAATIEGGLEEVDPVLIHRDLKLDHVFLSGNRVELIDCDSVAMGDPARDPAHLFAHIVGGVGLEDMAPAHRAALASAFVQEYFAHAPAAWGRAFQLHCAGALVEVAGGIFKRQEPHWRERVTAAVAEAEACLR